MKGKTQPLIFLFFFLNDPAPPEISPLPPHDALPISGTSTASAVLSTRLTNWFSTIWKSPNAVLKGSHNTTGAQAGIKIATAGNFAYLVKTGVRSEEHTSELQSQSNLVCRLLLEKKKK